QQARDAALLVLEKQPGDEQALLLLANGAVTPADIEETRKQIDDLRSRDQDRPGYHLALGTLNLGQKNLAEAENEFKAALELDPKSSAAFTALGILYEGRNDGKAAEEAFKTAAELSPLRSPNRVRYIDFKFRTGALDEAKNLTQEITAKHPDYL